MNDTRQIVAFMAFAVAFALVGHKVAPKTSVAGTDSKIILGGAIGATLLSLLAESGETGAKFAKGLAGITLISSVMINGTNVFTGLNKLTSGVSKTVAVPPTPAPALKPVP